MPSSGLRSFLKVLLVWSAFYVFVLYTWKKPVLPLDKTYLASYSLAHAPNWTPEEALSINSQSCPPKNVNYDVNAVKANKDRWAQVTETQIFFLRNSLLKYLETAKHEGQTSGRGIVMSAGDNAAFQRAAVNIAILRHYGCKLPVQIYHYEDEADTIVPTLIDKLSSLGADVIEIGGLKRGNEWKAYQIKAIAIQRCSFDEIMYLDTDSYLAKDPTYLFEAPEFRETGAMLWPDFTKSHPTNPIWRFLGMPCRQEFEAESGQILFNRAMHQQTMHVAEYFALENQRFYNMMGGDRDSFRIAMLALGKTWAGPRRLVATAGISRRTNGGHTMLQSDHMGNWLFIHANLLKHSALPRSEDEIWNKIRRLKNDTFVGKYGYGTLAGNEQLGDGVRVDVSSMPSMFTEYGSFREDQKEAAHAAWWDATLVEEDFRGADLAFIEFEKLWLKFGGKRIG